MFYVEVELWASVQGVSLSGFFLGLASYAAVTFHH